MRTTLAFRCKNTMRNRTLPAIPLIGGSHFIGADPIKKPVPKYWDRFSSCQTDRLVFIHVQTNELHQFHFRAVGNGFESSELAGLAARILTGALACSLSLKTLNIAPFKKKLNVIMQLIWSHHAHSYPFDSSYWVYLGSSSQSFISFNESIRHNLVLCNSCPFGTTSCSSCGDMCCPWLSP